MGNVLSLGNSIIFPAPTPSYTSQLYELIWIPKRFGCENAGPRKNLQGSFPVLYLPSPTPSKTVMVYLHGNSCDIGQVKPELRLISHEVNASIMAVEYPGYGVSPEVAVATGELIDARVRATINFLLSLGVDPRNLILFGRSIGTGPAAAMAAEFKEKGIQCGGVILQAPYLSVHRIVEDYFSLGTWMVPNFWDTVASLKKMAPTTPLLLIHGLIDEIIPVYHGQTLYESYQSELKMADFQPTSKHNVYSIIDDLCIPIGKFLTTLSLSKDAPIVDLKLPQWCLYSCRKLVNGQAIMERRRKTVERYNAEKQANSARLAESRVEPTITRHSSVLANTKFVGRKTQSMSPFQTETMDSGVSSSSPVLSHVAVNEVNRSVSKASYESSMQEAGEPDKTSADNIGNPENDSSADTTK